MDNRWLVKIGHENLGISSKEEHKRILYVLFQKKIYCSKRMNFYHWMSLKAIKTKIAFSSLFFIYTPKLYINQLRIFWYYFIFFVRWERTPLFIDYNYFHPLLILFIFSLLICYLCIFNFLYTLSFS